MKRRVYTNPDLRAALKAAMADARPPRVIYAKPDGREQMKPRTLAQWVRKHGARWSA